MTNNIIIYEKADYKIIAVFKTVAYTGFNYYKFVNCNSSEKFDTFIIEPFFLI